MVVDVSKLLKFCAEPVTSEASRGTCSWLTAQRRRQSWTLSSLPSSTWEWMSLYIRTPSGCRRPPGERTRPGIDLTHHTHYAILLCYVIITIRKRATRGRCDVVALIEFPVLRSVANDCFLNLVISCWTCAPPSQMHILTQYFSPLQMAPQPPWPSGARGSTPRRRQYTNDSGNGQRGQRHQWQGAASVSSGWTCQFAHSRFKTMTICSMTICSIWPVWQVHPESNCCYQRLLPASGTRTALDTWRTDSNYYQTISNPRLRCTTC